MKLILLLFCISLISCGGEKKEDVIFREIKLKEARKGREMVKLLINKERTSDDTTAIYYHAQVKTRSKDSTVFDSIFLIKGVNGVLLPFSTKSP